MAEENKIKKGSEIIKCLEDLISACKEPNCQFRIFGSLIIAAINGHLYRNIGDIDCFVDKKFQEAVVGNLENKGYVKLTGKDEDIPPPLYFIGFKTEILEKSGNKISLLFVFFNENYIKIPLRFGLSFRVSYNLINKNYKFYGREFKGLIPEAALFNLSLIRDKNKREIDFNALFPFCNPDIIQQLKNNSTFFLFNRRLPLISSFLSSKIDKFISKSNRF